MDCVVISFQTIRPRQGPLDSPLSPSHANTLYDRPVTPSRVNCLSTKAKPHSAYSGSPRKACLGSQLRYPGAQPRHPRLDRAPCAGHKEDKVGEQVMILRAQQTR
jgi:hypothetical protein